MMKDDMKWLESLREVEENLTLDNTDKLIADGLLVVRCEDNLPVEYVNDHMLQYLGYTDAESYLEANADGMMQIFWTEDRDYVRGEMERQLTENQQYKVMCRIINRRGKPVWVYNMAKYLPGFPDRLISFFYNVDESIQFVQQRGLDIQQFQDVMDYMPGGICILRWVDKHFEPLIMSRDLSRILQVEGDPRQDIYTSRQILYIHPEDQIRLDECILECVEENKSADITVRFRYDHQEDYRWINIKGNITEHEDGTKLCYISCTDVTTERELSVKLESSEYSFQTALENCNIYSGKYDMRNKITYFNKRVQEDFGLPEKLDNCHKVQLPILSDEDRQRLGDAFQAMCRDKRDSMTLEMPIRNVRGEQVWLSQSYTVVERDEQNNPLFIISTAIDITKHKLAEQRFNTENVYRQIMTKDTSSVVRINVTGWQILESVGESFGSDDCDTFFTSILETIPDSGMQMAFQHIFNQKNMLREFESGENKLSYVYRGRRSDGTVIWMETIADLILRRDGALLALVQVKDINHHMIVDQMSNSLIDKFTDFLAYYIKADGSSFILSEKEEYLYQSDEEADALQKLSNHIYAKLSTEEQQKMRKQINLKAIIRHLDQIPNYQYTYQIEEPDSGLRTKRINYYYLDQNNDVVVISQQDVTDMFREQALQKEELQRALDIATQASNIRDEFLSNVSHDLRTPLNGIIGASELAKGQVRDNPEMVEEYLNDIHSSGHFMLNLVNDILDMSRLEMGKQELEKARIDWTTFTWDLQQVFEPACREKALEMQIGLEEIPAVSGDAVQLRRVLQNLLSNAVKYTGPGGRVECRVIDTKMIRETLLVTIMVKDNGIGIGKEFQQHMFETFSRESNEINDRRMGSGFGLAIVKSLVDLMGGGIRCESEKGSGTTFYITLPFELYVGDAERQKRKRVQVEKKVLRGCKVLLVEDHPLNAKIVKRLLENMEITVEHAANGQEAVDAFHKSDLFFYDAILMDISMPVMDGIEATRRIRAMSRSDAHMIPIIALTANAFERDIQKSKSAGMNDHLTKPIDSGKLFETLIHFWKQ